ncbi:MAG: GNAT family N-acetyltransferase [Beijerinckiaceae bacterium]
MRIRDAQEDDFPAIQAIYAHHVLHGAGSFEEEPPGVETMLARFAAVRAHALPWIVVEEGGAIRGYAYARPYHERSAYRFTLENSVYVAPDAARRGFGRALLAELLARCAAGGYRQMIAIIGDSGNAGSIGLHSAMGFRHAGLLRGVGLKFGRTLDSVLMQKDLQG